MYTHKGWGLLLHCCISQKSLVERRSFGWHFVKITRLEIQFRYHVELDFVQTSSSSSLFWREYSGPIFFLKFEAKYCKKNCYLLNENNQILNLAKIFQYFCIFLELNWPCMAWACHCSLVKVNRDFSSPLHSCLQSPSSKLCQNSQKCMEIFRNCHFTYLE